MRLTGADIGRFRDDGYIYLPRLFGAAHPRRGGLCAPIQDRPQGPAGQAGFPVAPRRRLMVRLRRHAGAAGDELRGVFGRCDGVQRAARADPGLAPRRRSDRRRHAAGRRTRHDGAERAGGVGDILFGAPRPRLGAEPRPVDPLYRPCRIQPGGQRHPPADAAAPLRRARKFRPACGARRRLPRAPRQWRRRARARKLAARTNEGTER